MPSSLYVRLGRRFAPDRFNTSRREALKAALAASAGLLLSSCTSFPSRRPSARRVVIVGAGFAGLACAYELISAGYNVTVIEARARIGGRALSFSDMIPGKNIEGGGELIGSNHPTWMAYAKRFNLEFLDVSEHEDLAQPLVLGGKRIEAAKAKELFEAMDAAFNKMNADAAPVVEDEPWKTPNAGDLDRKTTQQWLDALDLEPLGKLGVAAELTANNGVALSLQSYLGNLSQVKGGGLEKYWSDSEVYRCKGGNDLVAKALANAITDHGKDRLILNQPVMSIDVNKDGATVTTADGRTFECDDVVLTVPPTVWKKIAISPALPDSLAPQMGINVKYLAVVKRPFWLDAKLAPDSRSDGDLSMTWESTDGQPAAGPSGATQVGLTAFSGGPAAAACRSRDKDARDAAYKDQLESIYPGFKASYESHRFMDWPGDPWTLAGYSFPAPGQITTMGPVLREGLGRLHFAGEHTCYKFVGYMEGGLNSGAGVARRLAARDMIVAAPELQPER